MKNRALPSPSIHQSRCVFPRFSKEEHQGTGSPQGGQTLGSQLSKPAPHGKGSRMRCEDCLELIYLNISQYISIYFNELEGFGLHHASCQDFVSKTWQKLKLITRAYCHGGNDVKGSQVCLCKLRLGLAA